MPKKKKVVVFEYVFTVTVSTKSEMTPKRREALSNSLMRLVHDRECWYGRVFGIKVEEVIVDG